MLVLELRKIKETRNKVVYGTANGKTIQGVYIDKDDLPTPPPDVIKHTLEW